MFERYTEKARRIVFFARYESSAFGSPSIEPEHVALALLREDRPLFDRILADAAKSTALENAIRSSLEPGPKISTSVDLPLSPGAKRILAYATEEAELSQERMIGSVHLLLGLLRQESGTTATLRAAGVTRELVKAKGPDSRVPASYAIVKELQTEFAPLASRLTPEIEPALVFSIPGPGETGE